jgi:hypothetical protein
MSTMIDKLLCCILFLNYLNNVCNLYLLKKKKKLLKTKCKSSMNQSFEVAVYRLRIVFVK